MAFPGYDRFVAVSIPGANGGLVARYVHNAAGLDFQSARAGSSGSNIRAAIDIVTDGSVLRDVQLRACAGHKNLAGRSGAAPDIHGGAVGHAVSI